VVYDVPIACNRASADLLISSPLWRRYAPYRAERATGIDNGAATGDGIRTSGVWRIVSRLLGWPHAPHRRRAGGRLAIGAE